MSTKVKRRPKKPSLESSIERKIIPYEQDHTGILMRFDLGQPLYSMVLKKGVFTTFGDFMEDKGPILSEVFNKPLDEVMEHTYHYFQDGPVL